MFKDRDTIQRDLGRLEKWVDRNLMKFIKEKHKLLPVGQRSPGNDTCWGWTCWDQFFGKGAGAQWTAN